MSTSQGAGSGGIDFAALLTSISAQPDPLDYLVKYLEGQRIPPQGSFFRIHAFAALGMHGW